VCPRIRGRRRPELVVLRLACAEGRRAGGSTIEALPDVVDAVGGNIPVLVDSGFRRGSDIFKALALGADAVCIGRPYVATPSETVRIANSTRESGKIEATGHPSDQNSTGGPCHESSRGRARASATPASHHPSHALRPGRRRQAFNSPLHFA